MALSESQLKILRTLRDGPLQAKEVAASLGIEPSSAHRHLVRLKEARLVDAEDVIEGPGRPKRIYHLSAAGMESFPRDYAFLLDAVLRQVEVQGGRDAVLRILNGISQELAAPLMDVGDLDERVRRLVALYNDLGFEATLEASGPNLVLVQRNCPFLRTARNDPEGMCQCLDEGIIKSALPDAEVRLGQSLAHGARSCRHLIRLGK